MIIAALIEAFTSVFAAPQYRHVVYALGYTGYDVRTLPGVREAIEQHQWKDANDQIVILAKVLVTYTAAVRQATPR